jgi:hypothetical protein
VKNSGIRHVSFFFPSRYKKINFRFYQKKMLLEWGQQQQQKGGSSVGVGQRRLLRISGMDGKNRKKGKD